MSSMAGKNGRPWYREFWPWALMLPPAAAVIGGLAMLYLATSISNSLVVDDYSRIEEITSERFARDLRATELGLQAELVFEETAEQTASLMVTVDARTYWERPRVVILRFRHAVDGAADREVVADWFDGAYVADVALAAGRYEIELTPPDGSWRLGGSLTRIPGRLVLLPHEGSGR